MNLPITKNIAWMTLVSLLLLYTAASTLYFFTRSDIQTSDSRTQAIESGSASDDVLMGMQDEIQQLKLQLASLLPRLDESKNKNNESPPRVNSEQASIDQDKAINITSYEQPSDPDLFQEQQAQDAVALQQAYMENVDRYFTSQMEDPAWTATISSDVTAALDEYPEQITLNSISCGDNLCRVKAVVNPQNAATGQALPPLDHLIHGGANWPGKSLYQMDMDTGEITMYLLREGNDFPAQPG